MKSLLVMVRNFPLAQLFDRAKTLAGKTKVISLALSTAFGIIAIDLSLRDVNDKLYGPVQKLAFKALTSKSVPIKNVPTSEDELQQDFPSESSGMYSFEKVRLGFIGNYSYQLSFLPKFELEQKILDSFPKALQKKVKPYVKPTLVICEKYQIDPFWIFSVMWTESHFRPLAESHVGARGLMQIMPRTKNYLLHLAKEESIVFEYEKGAEYLEYIFPLYSEARGKQTKKLLQSKILNIELGVFYLKKLLLYFNNNHLHATVAYNMGPGWTKKRLNTNRAVGVKNLYLDKVKKAYHYIISQFESSSGSV